MYGENACFARIILLPDPQYEDMIVRILSEMIFVVPVVRIYQTENGYKW